MEKKIYDITVKSYSQKMTYYDWDIKKSYPHFQVVHRMEFMLSLDSLDECEKWILSNFGSDYCMGYSISRKKINGDEGIEFHIDAEKDYYYYYDQSLTEDKVYSEKCKALGCEEKN